MDVSILLADQQRIYNMGIIAKRISFALWPWNPGKIVFETHDQYRLSHDVVEVRVFTDLFPSDPAIVYPQILASPDEQVWKMADEAFTHFRYRPALPVDDHIVLGEN